MLGEVSYGNIGAGDRLDFTAIGPAVNLTARLEPLTGGWQRPLLVIRQLCCAWSRRAMRAAGPTSTCAASPSRCRVYWIAA